MKFVKQFSISEHAGAVYSVAEGSKAHTFFSASADRHVVEWNVETGQQEPFVVKLEAAVYAILFSQKFQLLFIGNSNGGIHVIDYLSKKEIKYFTTHTNGIYDFAIDPKSDQLQVAGGDGFLSVWDISSLQLVRNIPLGNIKLRQLALNVEANILAVACGDGSVRILDLDFLNEKEKIIAHQGGATAVAWHTAKQVLVSGGKNAHVSIWNVSEEFVNVLSLPAHNYAIYSIVFGEGVCATSSRDKSIKIWDAQSFEPIQRMDAKAGGHSHSVNKLLYVKDLLISCSDDRKIIIWKGE